MSFFCVCPGISPQRCSARSHRGGRGRIISHSDGHSIVRSALCPHTNQLGIYYRFERSKFCKLSTNDKKSWYTAHQIGGRKSLAISLMKLCAGSDLQKPSVSAFFRSAGRRCDRSGAAAIPFVGCLVFHFRYSVVGSAMRVEYSIAYRTLVRQPFLNIALEDGTPKTVLTVKKITAATVSDSRRIG